MPHQPTAIEIQLKNLAECLTLALEVLNELNSAFAPPFVQPISSTVASLVKLIQNVKQNRKECAQLLENIYQVLYAIIELHIRSEATGSLSPEMTEHVGIFMKTLHRVFLYMEAQQDRKKLKQLFHNSEMNKVVKDCHAELDEAKKIFQVSVGGAIFKDIGGM
ncbi:hypothetical protein C8R45DRAFT_1213063, partial [Mycena sanguinolenta]